MGRCSGIGTQITQYVSDSDRLAAIAIYQHNCNGSLLEQSDVQRLLLLGGLPPQHVLVAPQDERRLMQTPHETSADRQRFVMLDIPKQAPSLRRTVAITTPYLTIFAVTRPYVTHQLTCSVSAAYP